MKHNAAGIDANLWTGPGMLAFGAPMVGWPLARPGVPDTAED